MTTKNNDMDEYLNFLPREEYKYYGRIAVCSPRKVKDALQHSLSGVMVTLDKNQPLLSNCSNWENIECEIIIRPIRRIGVAKIENMRLDHAALALSDEKQWK